MKLYDKVRKLLTDNPKLRDSDRELIWEVWKGESKVKMFDDKMFGRRECITKEWFMLSENTETIRRTRQKVQEDHPELGASKNVMRLRDEKQKMGQYFVYHTGAR